MRGLAVLIFIFISHLSISQFTTTEKKGKIGIQYKGSLIVKPKFDSVNINDSEIATAYKKSKTFYFNEIGEKIAKRKSSLAEPFKDGFAIISSKKGLYGAINKSGEETIPLIYSVRPEQFGRLLLVKKYNHFYYLYNPEKRLSGRIDSIKLDEQWLIGYQKKSEYHHYVKEGFLGRKKDKSYYTYDHYFNIYDFNKGVSILDSVVHFYQDQAFTIHTLIDSSITILNQQNEEIASGDYNDVQINENTIYSTLNKSKTTEIRDLDGKILREDLLFISSLDNSRHIFEIDSLQYIGNEYGEALSPKFNGFGFEQNGWRIIYDGFCYSYMNDSTYEVLNFRLPVVLKDKITYSGGGGNGWKLGRGIRNLKRRIGNFGRRFLGKPKKLLETGSYSHTIKEEKVPAYQYPVTGKYIKVCINCIDTIENRTAYKEEDINFRAKFNYLSLTGELVNSIAYDLVEPLTNDRFIARKDGKHFVVGTDGINKTREFNWIKDDTLGYYVTSLTHYPTIYGLLDSNLIEVLPCKYKDLKFVEDGFYQVDYRGKKRLRYKLPE